MKNILISIMSLLIGFAATCANAQGIKVTYLEQTKLPKNVKELSPEIRDAVETQLRQQNKTMCLYSYQGESLYTHIASNDEGGMQQGNTGIRTIKMGGDATVYKNLKEKQVISQEYILDKKFLIEEPLKAPDWKIVAEEKNIGSFKCKKAVNSNGDIAWYCRELPVNEGPGGYYGLPGLILGLETGAKTIIAQEIDLKYNAQGEIKKPDSGKKISREEFEETRTQKLERMGVQRGSSGVSIIKM